MPARIRWRPGTPTAGRYAPGTSKGRPAPGPPSNNSGRATSTSQTARYPVEQSVIPPTTVRALEKGHYFIDFGRDAFAGLKVTVSTPPEGATVVVHMGEALAGPQAINRNPGGSIRYHRAELKVTAGRDTYTVPLTKADDRRMPAGIGSVMPFRYVEVEGCPSVIDQDTVCQVMAHYPFNDAAATFVSSNRRLNEVWELCHYTMKATSFCGVFVDGDRERTPYEADAYINQLGYYCCDREYTIARYSHEYLLSHPTWPTEWKQHSILMAWADYQYTGDSRSLAAHYQQLVDEKLLTQAARADGLLDTKKLRDIVDWPAAERDGYKLMPVNTVVNAFHYRTLVCMGDIAQALGKPEDAARFRRQAERVKTAFNDKLFDAKTGRYVDGEGTEHSSLHANMFALAFGLVPEERRPRVVEFVKSRGMACSVYGAQYLLEALFEAGQADHAMALMTADTDRSWTHMIHDVGTTMTLEAWDNKYKPNQDWNHAWGAAPANILPRKLMGVEPTEAGFGKVRIRPQTGSLEWAKLDLPTIRGSIHVDFQSSPTRFVLNVRLPANMTAEVWAPSRGASGEATVLVDGVERRGRREGQFLVIEPVGSGAHSFQTDKRSE